MSRTNPKVDAYLKQINKWQDETRKLREIILTLPLTEELKWGKPCYSFDQSNVVLIAGFKDHCVLIVCKGALLKDPKGILIKPGENTQAARQIRFTSMREIEKLAPTVKAYLRELIEAEKAGAKIEYKKVTDHQVPDELQKKLDRDTKLKAAFQALTPGRQRGYLMHFSAAKQSATREARIEKCVPLILKGKGLQDDYRTSRSK